MFYIFSHTPLVDDTEAAPELLEMHLTAGIIHQVDVLFQDGCAHEIFVQIWQANRQLWPSNRGQKLRGNATVVSFREFHELKAGDTILTAKIWTKLEVYTYEVIIQIGLLPKRVLQPLSFEELLSAATGIEE